MEDAKYLPSQSVECLSLFNLLNVCDATTYQLPRHVGAIDDQEIKNVPFEKSDFLLAFLGEASDTYVALKQHSTKK